MATRLTREVIMKEASETATRPTVPPQQQLDPKDKGKVIMQDPEKPVKLKGKDQIEYDVDMAKRLQAKLDENVRLEREREEEASNARLTEEWDTIKARIDVDAQLAERLQAGERENKCLLRNKVNDFVPMDTKSSGKKVESSGKKAKSSIKKAVSKKRAGENLDEESGKRQKVKDDAEKAELKACLEIVPGDDSAVNIESLATKYPIVDWKTHILAEDKMLVKERFETTCPEGYDRLIWGDLITLFEPSEEDEIWKAQHDYTLISWRMLSRRLEVDHECEMAFELLRFTRSQLENVVEVTTVGYEVTVVNMEVTTAGYVSTAGEDYCDHGSFGAFPSYEAKHRLEIRCHVERKLRFLQGVGQKELGKESANESGSKFIPCFNSSFIEFVQSCFCFSSY
ncbi:hypothetical protein Tco_0335636 [Tanacetum coccineum]